MSRRTDEAVLWIGLTVALAIIIGVIVAFAI